MEKWTNCSSNWENVCGKRSCTRKENCGRNVEQGGNVEQGRNVKGEFSIGRSIVSVGRILCAFDYAAALLGVCGSF